MSGKTLYIFLIQAGGRSVGGGGDVRTWLPNNLSYGLFPKLYDKAFDISSFLYVDNIREKSI